MYIQILPTGRGGRRKQDVPNMDTCWSILRTLEVWTVSYPMMPSVSTRRLYLLHREFKLKKTVKQLVVMKKKMIDDYMKGEKSPKNTTFADEEEYMNSLHKNDDFVFQIGRTNLPFGGTNDTTMNFYKFIRYMKNLGWIEEKTMGTQKHIIISDKGLEEINSVKKRYPHLSDLQ